jgi:predicted TIM-barrel fold metal-dependent hydrolase
VNGTLRELDYLYHEQKLCNGVTVYTTYGDKLLGNIQFVPIWQRLQKYKALVFLHPGVLAVAPEFVASSLPQPIIDYPIATTRTAVDLVMTRTLHRFPDVDIILSHAGGTIPFIAERAIGSLAVPEIAKIMGYDMVKAKRDFARFYYDIALSTSDAQLHGLLDFVDSSHILFGSDFPYAPQFAINALLAKYAAFVATDQRGSEVSPARLRENSLKLLNKHALKKAI